MKKKLYIAYGSNLNKEQMKYRCPHAKPIASGLINGWKLVFRGSKTGAYCTIIPSEHDCVPVGIWEISEMDENRLDRYEGYPTFYNKKTVNLMMSGVKNKALVYIMRADAQPGQPSQLYIDICRQGYEDFGLPIDVWEQAIDYNRTELKS